MFEQLLEIFQTNFQITDFIFSFENTLSYLFIVEVVTYLFSTYCEIKAYTLGLYIYTTSTAISDGSTKTGFSYLEILIRTTNNSK